MISLNKNKKKQNLVKEFQLDDDEDEQDNILSDEDYLKKLIQDKENIYKLIDRNDFSTSLNQINQIIDAILIKNSIKFNQILSEFYDMKAQLFLQLDQPFSSIQFIEKAIELNKDSYQYYQIYGRSLREFGDIVKSKTIYEECLKLYEKNIEKNDQEYEEIYEEYQEIIKIIEKMNELGIDLNHFSCLKRLQDQEKN